MLSAEEKTLGLSKLRGDRLTFPQALPAENEPVALELADLSGDGVDEVVYIARQRQGRSSKYALHALRRDKGGKWKPHTFGSAKQVALELPATPKRLVKLDANGDGRPEFLVFLGLDRPPQFLTVNAEGVPVPVRARGGFQLGDVPAGAVFVGRAQRPLVLVAQENFARNLQLDDKQQWPCDRSIQRGGIELANCRRRVDRSRRQTG